MAYKEKYKVSKVIAAIQGTGGVKTAIAQTLGCDRHTVDKYLERYPRVAQAYEDEVNTVGDICEHGIIKHVRDGDKDMLKFYAKTKLKDRGYTEREEKDINLNDKGFTINIIDDDE